MAHPCGGMGSRFITKHTFEEAYQHVGVNGCLFTSTTGEHIQAKQGLTRDKVTKTVVYTGERSRHGSVCEACWGFRTEIYQSSTIQRQWTRYQSKYNYAEEISWDDVCSAVTYEKIIKLMADNKGIITALSAVNHGIDRKYLSIMVLTQTEDKRIT